MGSMASVMTFIVRVIYGVVLGAVYGALLRYEPAHPLGAR